MVTVKVFVAARGWENEDLNTEHSQCCKHVLHDAVVMLTKHYAYVKTHQCNTRVES